MVCRTSSFLLRKHVYMNGVTVINEYGQHISHIFTNVKAITNVVFLPGSCTISAQALSKTNQYSRLFLQGMNSRHISED